MSVVVICEDLGMAAALLLRPCDVSIRISELSCDRVVEVLTSCAVTMGPSRIFFPISHSSIDCERTGESRFCIASYVSLTWCISFGPCSYKYTRQPRRPNLS